MAVKMAAVTSRLMENKNLPFHIPSIGEREIEEVVDTLRSGWITTGPKTVKFEERFREYIGCGHAVAVSSCTAGLLLALKAVGVGHGDEVITTPYTFAATSEVIIQLGAKPVFVDVEPEGYNIDPNVIQKAISKHTRAIVPVHFAGEPCRMDAIMELARQNQIAVIEDAAHALGAKYKERKIGTIGELTAFSFYATKNLTTGEGGMVTTADEKLAERIKILSLHGLSKDAYKRYSREGSWYYQILDIGFKANMTDLQAALGLHQIQKFDSLQQKRHNYAKMYSDLFIKVPEIQLPPDDTFCEHAWHLYVIRIQLESLTINRADFINALGEAGIGTSVHFIPLHLHPYYQRTYGFKYGDYPNAERAYERSVSLPLYPEMTCDDVLYVGNKVKEIITANRKAQMFRLGGS